MEDVHRFFRYMIPGLAFILEIFLLNTTGVFVVGRPFVNIHQTCVCHYEQSESISEKIDCHIATAHHNDVFTEYLRLFLTNVIGNPLWLFLISVVIGWFLSVIFRTFFIVDHRNMLAKASEWKHIAIRKYGEDGNNAIPVSKLTRRGAWRVFSSLWYKNGLIPDAAVKNQEKKSDYMHSFGAVFVGSIIALLLWCIILIQSSPLSCCEVLTLLCFSLLPILWSIILWCSYRKSLKDAQGFVEIVLATKLDECYWNNRQWPMKIFVFDRDLIR